MSAKESPDNESLMALHALLQIRANKNVKCDGDKLMPLNDLDKNISASASGKTSNTSDGRADNRISLSSSESSTVSRSPALASLIRYNPGGFFSSKLGYTSAEVAAINATCVPGASFSAAAAAAIANRNAESVILARNGLYSITPPQQVLPSNNLQAASALPPAIAPTGHHQFQERLGVSVDTAVQSKIEKSRTNADANTYKCKGSMEEASEVVIRKDEVEAALRSKPQRGRKRENLNVMERLELTRTRNREHAKSTRIRKKARYQELVQCEQKFLEMQKAESLDSDRRTCVAEYFEAREKMLHSLMDKLSPSLDWNNDAVKEDALKIDASATHEQRQSQKLHHHHPFVSLEDLYNECEKVDKFPPELTDFVHNSGTNFQFGVAGNVDHARLHGGSPAAMMNRFDASIGACVTRHYGQTAVSELRYKIVGGAHTVALTKNGSGFARVDLIVDINEKRTETVFSSVVSLRFESDSSKISAVQWCILNNYLNILCAQHDIVHKQNQIEEKDSLQTIYQTVDTFSTKCRTSPVGGEKRNGNIQDCIEDASYF